MHENQLLKNNLLKIKNDKETEKKSYESLEKQIKTLQFNVEFERSQKEKLKYYVETLETNLA